MYEFLSTFRYIKKTSFVNYHAQNKTKQNKKSNHLVLAEPLPRGSAEACLHVTGTPGPQTL